MALIEKNSEACPLAKRCSSGTNYSMLCITYNKESQISNMKQIGQYELLYKSEYNFFALL